MGSFILPFLLSLFPQFPVSFLPLLKIHHPGHGLAESQLTAGWTHLREIFFYFPLVDIADWREISNRDCLLLNLLGSSYPNLYI